MLMSLKKINEEIYLNSKDVYNCLEANTKEFVMEWIEEIRKNKLKRELYGG